MHLSQYLLGVVTLVEICTTLVAPCWNIQNLQKPGEDRPKARSILLSVSATEFIAHLKAGRKGHPSKPKKVRGHRVTRGTSHQA